MGAPAVARSRRPVRGVSHPCGRSDAPGIVELDAPAPADIAAALWPRGGPSRVVVNLDAAMPRVGDFARWVVRARRPPEWAHLWALHGPVSPPRMIHRAVLSPVACLPSYHSDVQQHVPLPTLCTAPLGWPGPPSGTCTACVDGLDSGGPLYQLAPAAVAGAGVPTFVVVGTVHAHGYFSACGWRGGGRSVADPAERVLRDGFVRVSSWAGWTDAVVGARTGASLVTASAGVRPGLVDGTGVAYAAGPVRRPALLSGCQNSNGRGCGWPTGAIAGAVVGGVAVLRVAAALAAPRQVRHAAAAYWPCLPLERDQCWKQFLSAHPGQPPVRPPPPLPPPTAMRPMQGDACDARRR